MLGRLREVLENDPPPPPPLPPLPTARGNPARTYRGRVVWLMPRTPRKHPALAAVQARAFHLRLPHPPRLQRPRLHVDHDHPRQSVFLELVSSYVWGEAPTLWLSPPSPWERWVIADQLDQLDARVASHQWGHRHRIADVRNALLLPAADPRPW